MITGLPRSTTFGNGRSLENRFNSLVGSVRESKSHIEQNIAREGSYEEGIATYCTILSNGKIIGNIAY